MARFDIPSDASSATTSRRCGTGNQLQALVRRPRHAEGIGDGITGVVVRAWFCRTKPAIRRVRSATAAFPVACSSSRPFEFLQLTAERGQHTTYVARLLQLCAPPRRRDTNVTQSRAAMVTLPGHARGNPRSETQGKSVPETQGIPCSEGKSPKFFWLYTKIVDGLAVDMPGVGLDKIGGWLLWGSSRRSRQSGWLLRRMDGATV